MTHDRDSLSGRDVLKTVGVGAAVSSRHPVSYSVQQRTWHAAWITAPDDYLMSLETFPEGELPLGQWVWQGAYVRAYLGTAFQLDAPWSKAELQFQGDNEFSVFVNGHEVPAKPGAQLWDTGRQDVTGRLITGTNQVAIRAYQSADPAHFTSALRGVVRVELADGRRICLLTGDGWRTFHVCSFFEGKEPEHWATSIDTFPKGGALKQAMHPRLSRRSCYFRKDFVTDGEVEAAILHASARGLFEARINGQRVGDGYLMPGCSKTYQQYREFDVSSLVRKGANAIAFVTGNGWWNTTWLGEMTARKIELLAEIEIHYRDGRTAMIATDGSWHVKASPLVDDDLQLGERYDARLETPGWDRAETAPASSWVTAAPSTTAFEELPLVLDACEPVRVTHRLKPVERTRLASGAWLLDFGQNAAGRVRLTVRNASPGARVFIRMYERLDEQGVPAPTVYSDVLFPQDNAPDGRAPFASKNLDVYVCKGGTLEIYDPRFTYTGFRYALIEGYPGEPTNDDVEFMVMHSDLPVTGRLETSFAPFQRIWEATTWSYRSNIHTGPTDCPTREKNFWNGDIQAFVDTACWYMDNSLFLGRWTDGGRKMHPNCYGWEDEEYIVPWALYRFYDDAEVLRMKYPVIQKLIEKRQRSVKEDGLPDGRRAPYRDHVAVKNVPSDFYAGCYHCLMFDRAARIARVLGLDDDASRYRAQFLTARDAFNVRYRVQGEADYTPRCQSGIVLPLAFGLVPDGDRANVADRLARYVVEDGHHPATGFMASAHLLPLLCDYGHETVAMKTAMQEGHPSWRYMLSTGATTITEHWSGLKVPDGPESMNHYAFGSICRWFFEYLGGIRLDPEVNGFKTFILKPLFCREVGDFKASYRSRYGEIVSRWAASDEGGKTGFAWDIEIPQGTSATIILPDGKTSERGPGEHSLVVDQFQHRQEKKP